VTSDLRDRRRNRRRRRAVVWVALSSGGLLAGCGKQSILQTRSPQAHNIMLLWWWMLGAAAIVFLGALAMLVIAWFRRGTPGLPLFGEREEINERMVLTFGIAIPAVVLVVLFGVSDVYLVGQTSPPNPQSTAMTIDVIGHQWWWEVRYPKTGARTANEIHIPVNTRVNVVATTTDVIHSFWVPALNRKIDMIPGRRNRVLLYASRAGEYRGQCSQFCGLQHANMALEVIAQSPAAFKSWLANMSGSAGTSASTQAQAGQRLFDTSQCASCHRIAGTSAQGTVGPDLTHLATRSNLASVTIPNTPAELAAWISNPQAIKPGARMPDLGLSRDKVAQLVAYLETLR
ncbi:MAG: cytochrome c oxidase subunit II, partial [Solirubrobacteraceae bacterium]